MRRLLLTTALIAFAGGAHAQTACTDDGATMICDPTAFHVSAPGATGQDPVLLNNSTTFTLTEVGNHTINQPIRVLIIEPDGPNLSSITGVNGLGTGGPFSFGAQSITALGAFNTADNKFDGPAVTISAGQDLVKQIGFNGGAASISFQNIKDEYNLLGLTVPTKFDVFDAAVPVGFNSDSDFLTALGFFPKGTIISAIALDIDTSNPRHVKIDVFDNSWTTAGFVNTLGSPVPEPSTWAMMLLGFVGFAFFGWRSRASRAFA